MILIPSCICFLNNLNILSILFLDYSVISIFWWDISPIWKDFSFFLYLLSSSFFSCALKCVVTIHVEQGLLFTQFRTRSWVVSFGSWSTKTAKIPDWANLSPLLVLVFLWFPAVADKQFSSGNDSDHLKVFKASLNGKSLLHN